MPADLAAGSYYFIVATDRPVVPPNVNPLNTGFELVDESSYSNNETASAVNVSLAPVPDLSVSNVTEPMPATVVSGSQLTVGWTVTNNGAAVTQQITDSVYLSYAPDFDPVKYVGSLTYYMGLANGASYTQTGYFHLPSGLAGTFYVFVETNSNGNVFVRDASQSTADNATALEITLTPPADLVAGTVTIPGNAFAGQNMTVTYQVTNEGSNPADGTWYDSLYLSPTPTWSLGDTLLGTVTQTQDLAANGGTYTGTLTAPVPGVAPGNYYVIVRSNILDTLPETTLSNNLSASLTETTIDAQPLTVGTPTTGNFFQEGQFAYFKVSVAAGQTLQINLVAGLLRLLHRPLRQLRHHADTRSVPIPLQRSRIQPTDHRADHASRGLFYPGLRRFGATAPRAASHAGRVHADGFDHTVRCHWSGPNRSGHRQRHHRNRRLPVLQRHHLPAPGTE